MPFGSLLEIECTLSKGEKSGAKGVRRVALSPCSSTAAHCAGRQLQAGTAGKHLAQGSHEVWTRGSSPFLLLPGSPATGQCGSGQ